MADSITLTNGDLLASTAQWIQGQVETTSPFLAAATQIQPERGGVYTLNSLKITGNAALVEEGGKKPVLKMEKVSTQLPVIKPAFIVTFTEEVAADNPGFYDFLRNAAVDKLVSDLNGYIYGSLKPTNGVNIQSFSDAAVTQVNLGEDTAFADYRTAHKTLLGQGFRPNAVVASNSAFGAISMAVPTAGSNLAPLDGSNWYGANVATTKSLPSGAVLGDFTQAVYGLVDGVSMRLATTGTVPDSITGEEVNLLVENKIAAVVEMRLVWGLKDERAFVKLNEA